MTNSLTIGNTGSGLRVVAKATKDITKINLGTGTAADAGNNYIYTNTGAGICLFANPIGPMNAKGNIFSSNATKDCTGTPTVALTHIADCSIASDIAFALAPQANITIDKCVFLP